MRFQEIKSRESEIVEDIVPFVKQHRDSQLTKVSKPLITMEQFIETVDLVALTLAVGYMASAGFEAINGEALKSIAALYGSGCILFVRQMLFISKKALV